MSLSFGSTPSFGTSTAAPSGGFGGTSFGSAPSSFGFGAASSTAFGFGNSSTGSGFGIGASNPGSGFGFGTSSSGSGFGFGGGFTGFATSSTAPQFQSTISSFGVNQNQNQNQNQNLGVGGNLNPNPTSPEQLQFQQSVVRTDGRPSTRHTKFQDLTDPGKHSLQLVEREVVTCQRLRAELRDNEHLKNSLPALQDFGKDVEDIQEMLRFAKDTVQSDQDALEVIKPKAEWLYSSTHKAGELLERGKLWLATRREILHQGYSNYNRKELARPVTLPNEFLDEMVGDLEENLVKLQTWLSELEKAMKTRGGRQSDMGPDSLQVLEGALMDMHKFYVHVGAKVEGLESEVNKARDAFLLMHRQQGIMTNPFEEAEQEEQRREEVLRRPTAAQTKKKQAPPYGTPVLQNGTALAQQPQALTGNQATGTSLFGGQSQPGFGTTAFGQSSTPSLFGGSSPSTFGQSSGGPLFGAQSGSGAAFGTTGLFGASSGASGLSFGQPSSVAFGTTSFGASSGVSGGGLFGQTTTPAKPSGGVFGQQSSTAFGVTSSVGGVFGQPAASGSAPGFATAPRQNRGRRRT